MTTQARRALGAMTALLFAGLASVQCYRAGASGYRVGLDHSWPELAATPVEEVRDGDRLMLAAPADGSDTGFLEVYVRPTILGRLLAPRVELTSGGRTFAQQFEIGAAGRRYINVSTFLDGERRDTVRISLQPRRTRIDAAQVSIVRFRNVLPDDGPVLVIAPHPDDAEIAAFGLYSSRDAVVVTIGNGELDSHGNGALIPDVEERARRLARLRVWNSLTIPWLGGVSPDRAINLGYGPLEDLFDADARSRAPDGAGDFREFRAWNRFPVEDGEPSLERLIEDLEQIVAAVQPAVIVAPHPDLDGHIEHRLATAALAMALDRLDYRSGTLLLYVVHLFFSNEYPTGPMHTVVSLPPRFESPVRFESIYSHDLDESAVLDKFFALESMHALRYSSDVVLPRSAATRVAKDMANRMLGRYNDHFRRSVRANELFFVLDLAELADSATASAWMRLEDLTQYCPPRPTLTLRRGSPGLGCD